MNVRELIIYSIGATTLSGCYCGDLSFEEENVEYSVTANTIVSLSTTEGAEITDISCEQVCEYVRFAASYTVTDCSMEIDYSLVEAAIAGEESSDNTEGDDTADSYDDDPLYAQVGTVTCSGSGEEICKGGRRPLGYQEQEGGYFARMAHLEASSVVAFQQLIVQFKKFRAPEEFVFRAKKAINDEKRHAAQIAMLARRYNQEVSNNIEVQEYSEDLFEIALHNALEGCIFETWAAVEAQIISQTAQTEEIRAIYAGIAKDETEHAQLSWDVHLWLMDKLSTEEKGKIRQAQKEALKGFQEKGKQLFENTPAILGLTFASEEIIERFTKQIAV